MWLPDWDEIVGEKLFELPGDILAILNPGEVAQTDQVLARIKEVGGRALDRGQEPEAVIELIIDDLEGPAAIVGKAMERSLKPPAPPLLDMDMDPDFEKDPPPVDGMPW